MGFLSNFAIEMLSFYSTKDFLFGEVKKKGKIWSYCFSENHRAVMKTDTFGFTEQHAQCGIQ